MNLLCGYPGQTATCPVCQCHVQLANLYDGVFLVEPHDLAKQYDFRERGGTIAAGVAVKKHACPIGMGSSSLREMYTQYIAVPSNKKPTVTPYLFPGQKIEITFANGDKQCIDSV